MSDDHFPPCDDSYCTGPYRVDDVEVIKTSEIDDHMLAQILACEYGKADVSEEYTLDILCLMALADEFGFEYGEFVTG